MNTMIRMCLCLFISLFVTSSGYAKFDLSSCLENLYKADNIDKNMNSCIKRLAEQKSENAAQQLQDKDIDVQQFKKELKNKLIQAGKNVWNKYKDKYKNLKQDLAQAQDKLDSLEKALDSALQKAKDNFIDKIEQMDDFEGNVKETAQKIVEQADQKEPTEVEKFFGRLNIQRFYFNGSAQDIVDGVFPEVWVITGIGDDSHCARFQFDANKPVQSVHEINTQLLNLFMGDNASECNKRPIPQYSC